MRLRTQAPPTKPNPILDYPQLLVVNPLPPLHPSLYLSLSFQIELNNLHFVQYSPTVKGKQTDG